MSLLICLGSCKKYCHGQPSWKTPIWERSPAISDLFRPKKYGKFEAFINSYQTMPPSQLKRLKASLREQGLVGPQQSKKQKKQNAQSGANKEKRVQRTVALNGIREQFNPFEFKLPAKGPKFEVTTNKTVGGRVTKSVTRPGLAKARSEESVCLAPKVPLSY
jgi:hypothetical protein